jgi:hypothetical protein
MSVNTSALLFAAGWVLLALATLPAQASGIPADGRLISAAIIPEPVLFMDVDDQIQPVTGYRSSDRQETWPGVMRDPLQENGYEIAPAQENVAEVPARPGSPEDASRVRDENNDGQTRDSIPATLTASAAMDINGSNAPGA